MFSLMMISDMLSKHVGAVKSVLKKWFKINDIQLVHYDSVIISNPVVFTIIEIPTSYTVKNNINDKQQRTTCFGLS